MHTLLLDAKLREYKNCVDLMQLGGITIYLKTNEIKIPQSYGKAETFIFSDFRDIAKIVRKYKISRYRIVLIKNCFIHPMVCWLLRHEIYHEHEQMQIHKFAKFLYEYRGYDGSLLQKYPNNALVRGGEYGYGFVIKSSGYISMFEIPWNIAKLRNIICFNCFFAKIE